MWFGAVLAIVGLGLALSVRNSRADPADSATTTPTTTPPPTPTTSATIVDDVPEPPPLQIVTRRKLRHSESEWIQLGEVEFNRTVAIRAGDSIVVIDPSNQLAHRIDLPEPSAEVGLTGDDDFAGRQLALVADKVITFDNGFLRSLSMLGGVDVLLSNSSLGFEVATQSAIVSGIQVVKSPEPGADLRLVPQGVHYPSARDQVVGAFGVADLDLLPSGSAVSAVQDKLFVTVDGELHRKTHGELVSLGPGRAFAASADWAVVERCEVLFEYCSYDRVSLANPDQDGQELAVPKEFSRSDVVLSPDGNSLFVLSDGSEVQKLVDISDRGWKVVYEFRDNPFRYSAVAFDPESSLLILVSGASLTFWDGQSQGEWRVDGLGEITEIAIGRSS